MAGHGVDRRSNCALRDLVLVVESEPDVDPDKVDRSVRRLRAELNDLDIESITPVNSEMIPRGAKGFDPLSLGALVITLSATGGALTHLVETARDWLVRQAVARRVSVTIDGDTIVLEKSSAHERSALLDAYLRRHEVAK